MSLIFQKIAHNKRQYIILLLSLIIIQTLLVLIGNFLLSKKERIMPDLPYSIKNCYELRLLSQNYKDDQLCYQPFEFNHNHIKNLTGISGLQEVILSEPVLTGGAFHFNNYACGDVSDIKCAKTGTNFCETFDLDLLGGTSFQSKSSGIQDAVISKMLADSLKISANQLPQLISIEKSNAFYINGKGKKVVAPVKDLGQVTNCRVVGIIDNIEVRGSEKVIFLPLYSSEQVIIKLQPDADLNEIEEKIDEIMSPQLESKPIIKLVDIKLLVYELWYETRRMNITVLSIIPLVLLYTLLAVFGIFWLEINRDKQKYGIMRAIGANRFQLFLLLMKEAFLLAFASSAFCLLIIFNIRNLVQMTDDYWILFASSILIVAGLLVLAVLWPAFRITQIKPIKALADE